MKGSKNMSWVNLDDVYVNKSGDSIAGNLSVGGALTINDGKGTDTTYNVANEITTLRDSVSHVAPWVKHKTITGTTSGAGNIPFEGLEIGKCVILSAIAVSGDNVVIPYTGYPSRGILGAHVIKDSKTYTAVINSMVTIDVYYFELS